ncbi:MAG: hypothetical protein ACI37Z_09125 [Candidatus Gastranaerophilaceae bacterium]
MLNIKIIKAHYKNEKNNDFTIEHFTLDELNSKIIPTNEINEKYKKIRNINITGSEYLLNLKKNYSIKPENEIWRKYPNNEDFEISIYGRVKLNKKILDFKNVKKLAGYLYLDLDECRKYKPVLNDKYVYQIVAKTWLIKPQNSCSDCTYEVHHISNDDYDNRVDNLIYLNEYEHSKINHKSIFDTIRLNK